MSLIYFHVVLIAAAIVFSLGFGLRELHHFGNFNQIPDLLTALGSLAGAFLFAVYLFWFVGKNREKFKG